MSVQFLLHHSKSSWPRFWIMTGVNWSLGVNALVDINFKTNVFKKIHCNCKTTCTVTTRVCNCSSSLSFTYIFFFFLVKNNYSKDIPYSHNRYTHLYKCPEKSGLKHIYSKILSLGKVCLKVKDIREKEIIQNSDCNIQPSTQTLCWTFLISK